MAWRSIRRLKSHTTRYAAWACPRVVHVGLTMRQKVRFVEVKEKITEKEIGRERKRELPRCRRPLRPPSPLPHAAIPLSLPGASHFLSSSHSQLGLRPPPPIHESGSAEVAGRGLRSMAPRRRQSGRSGLATEMAVSGVVLSREGEGRAR